METTKEITAGARVAVADKTLSGGERRGTVTGKVRNMFTGGDLYLVKFVGLGERAYAPESLRLLRSRKK